MRTSLGVARSLVHGYTRARRSITKDDANISVSIEDDSELNLLNKADSSDTAASTCPWLDYYNKIVSDIEKIGKKIKKFEKNYRQRRASVYKGTRSLE